jgi:hypothetical protein
MLVTDWPALCARHGFTIVDRRDIIADTIETWDRVRAVYEQRSVDSPPLRPPARPPNPRADRPDSGDTRQVRNLSRPLGAQVIATKIEVPKTLAPWQQRRRRAAKSNRACPPRDTSRSCPPVPIRAVGPSGRFEATAVRLADTGRGHFGRPFWPG